MNNEENGLGLVVPDAETDISSIKGSQPTESAGEKEMRELREKAEQDMFKDSGDTNDIKVEAIDKDVDKLKSRDTEKVISEDTIRTVYVNKVDGFQLPCVVIDLTHVTNMRIGVLRQIRSLVYTDDELNKMQASDEFRAEYETSVYTKYESKIVHIGYMNKGSSLRLLICLLSQADIGEINKNFTVKYAKEDGKFRSMDLRNSSDYILL